MTVVASLIDAGSRRAGRSGASDHEPEAEQSHDHLRDSDDGFTLLEVVVGFTLLVIVAAGLVAAITNGARITAISQQRAAAANIARQYIESARTPNSGLSITSTPSAVSVPGTSFKVCRTVNPVGSPAVAVDSYGCKVTAEATGTGAAAPTGCTQSNSAGLLYYVTVVVTWPSNSSTSVTNANRQLRNNTVMAC